jgi:hypothetical protein
LPEQNRFLPGVLEEMKYSFLGASAKLQKVAFSFVMTVRSHVTTQLPLDGFSLNLIFVDFLKIYRENPGLIKSDKNNRHFTRRPVYIYDI